jgi:GTP-binding protein
LPIVKRANEARNLRIPTSKLNQFFEENVTQPKVGGGTAPGSGGNVRLHVQYITQAGMRPPMFVVFTSGGAGGKGGLHFSYLRYIENRLRESFDFFATPIRLKEKHKTKKK